MGLFGSYTTKLPAPLVSPFHSSFIIHQSNPTPSTDSPSKSTTWRLLSLPTELHLEILSYLKVNTDDDRTNDEFSLPRLRLVNRYFHSLIPAPTHAALLRLQPTPFATDKLLTCKLCVCLRPRIHFSYDAYLFHPDPAEQGDTRFCRDGGFADREDGEGFHRRAKVQILENDEIYCIWCRDCKHWKAVVTKRAKCWWACKKCTDELGCRCEETCWIQC